MKLPDPKSIRRREPDKRSPYRLREPFMSASELSVHRTLLALTGDRYVICPKVALNDIFLIVRPNENVHYFNKLFRKHVDFLVCERETFEPAFAVVLVKPMQENTMRQSDEFIEELFLGAGLPLLQLPSGGEYRTEDLLGLLELAQTKVGEREPRRAADKADSVPMCPVCGRMMVLRVHRHGRHAGRQYYGCTDNPHCPGVVAIT